MPPGPPTRASALDPMGALGSPQTPRRSPLNTHSFTSSYAPDWEYVNNPIRYGWDPSGSYARRSRSIY